LTIRETTLCLIKARVPVLLHVVVRCKSAASFKHTLRRHIPQDIVTYLLKERTVEPEKQPSLANGSARNSRGTVGNGGFYGGPCLGLVSRTTGAGIGSWKGAAVQRGLEHRSRGIAIVRARTRQLLAKTLPSGKNLLVL
jgi:hypothetical protein